VSKRNQLEGHKQRFVQSKKQSSSADGKETSQGKERASLEGDENETAAKQVENVPLVQPTSVCQKTQINVRNAVETDKGAGGSARQEVLV